MPQRKNFPKYTGILADPIQYQEGYPLLLMSDEENHKRAGEAKAKNDIAVLERVVALFEYYNIDLKVDDAWIKMVITLASAHVPGFTPKFSNSPKRGKPRQWNLLADTRLYGDVRLGLKKNESVSAVCGHLSKTPEYKGVGRATLERRYRLIIKSKSALPLMFPPDTYDAFLKAFQDSKTQFPTIKTSTVIKAADNGKK